MKLLCLSNGHGEDVIALRILEALHQQANPPEVVALPLVGKGYAYTNAGIPLLSPGKTLPSGGFVYMDGRQLWRDLRGGLVGLTLAQLRSVQHWAQAGGNILAVGDIVPLLFAWWSGAPYAFVGTAKSEYYLRDEQGWLPRRNWFERLESWSGSVFLPWERSLMRHPRCRAVFPRDRLTAQVLQQWQIPACDLGNPMMDGLEPTELQPTEAVPLDQQAEQSLTFVLLPGSRVPEAYRNWQVLTEAMAAIGDRISQPLLFLAAIAPGVDLLPLSQTLEAHGWQQVAHSPLCFRRRDARLVLAQVAFNDCLHQADVALAMAGTATEQFVGLGKPALIFPGRGPQFTPAFAEAQTRLLGCSAILVQPPAAAADVLLALLNDPDRLQSISLNGRQRMGEPGAAQRIARCLMEQFHSPE